MVPSLISNRLLLDLKTNAVNSPRFRQHLNLHKSYIDPCQRFLNSICSNSYIRPHCHDSKQGNETLFVVSGVVALLIFNEGAHVTEVHFLGSEKYLGDYVNSVGAEIRPGCWHTIVALSSTAVLLEVKSGPYNPESPKFFAPWAPEENSGDGPEYLEHLKRVIGEFK